MHPGRKFKWFGLKRLWEFWGLEGLTGLGQLRSGQRSGG